MAQAVQILFPVGRLVMGSLYTPQDKDAEGKALVVKSGPNAGTARVDYFFALAIPKNPGETHFAQTPFGAEIWKAAHLAFPNASQFPAFAWKVIDGDSAVPNRKNKKPCDREGYPGHWVVTFSGGFAPKVYQVPPGAKDPVIWEQKDAVNLGDYVEVYGNVSGNGSSQQPGVFINHSMVCFRGFGQRIVMGPDAGAVGFGASALPAGASTTPPAGTVMPAIPAAAAPAPLPPVPGAAAAPAVPAIPGIPAATIAPHLPVPGVVAPVPVPPAPVVPTPPVPVAPTGPVLTPKGAGQTYAGMIAGGWTDALLREHGYMV